MAVLATTATKEEIEENIDNSMMLYDCEFEDMDRSFEENGETYHVFALFRSPWGREIEKTIIKSGKKFKWL